MAERPRITLNFWGFVMLAFVGCVAATAVLVSLAMRLFSARSMGCVLLVVVFYQLAFRLLPRLATGQDFEWWPDFALLLVGAPLAVLFLALARLQQSLDAIQLALLAGRTGAPGVVIEPVTIDAVVVPRNH